MTTTSKLSQATMYLMDAIKSVRAAEIMLKSEGITLCGVTLNWDGSNDVHVFTGIDKLAAAAGVETLPGMTPIYEKTGFNLEDVEFFQIVKGVEK